MVKTKQRLHSSTPVIEANSFFILFTDNSNTYILTQTHILFNNIHLILESLKKSSSKLNFLLIKLAYVYHLNSFMPLLIKLILMVTLMKNSLLKRFFNSITFLIFLYGSPFSFMTVLNIKQINIFLINPKTFLLLYHFMKLALF